MCVLLLECVWCLFFGFLASFTRFHWLRISEVQDGLLLIRFISQRLVIEDVEDTGSNTLLALSQLGS